MQLHEVQRQAWTNKVRKGFNTTDPVKEIALLHGEVSEAFEALRKGTPADVVGELADVVIFAAGLAEMLNVDLCSAVTAKLAINAGRVYMRNDNGELIKVEQ